MAGYAPDVYLFDCWRKWEHNGIEEWKAVVTEWFGGMEEEGVGLRTELMDEVIKKNEGLAHVHGAIKFAGLDKKCKEFRSLMKLFTFLLETASASTPYIRASSRRSN